MKRVILAAVAALFIAVTPVMATGNHKHTICHATGSESNPFVQISPSKSGVYHGHIKHQHGEDIIPPFEYKGKTYSQNWDAAGKAIYRNGCEVEPVATPTPEPTQTPSPSETPEPTPSGTPAPSPSGTPESSETPEPSQPEFVGLPDTAMSQ